MYCINCGVKLADSEKKCPLCATRVYHPDFPAGQGESNYPKDRYPRLNKRSKSGAVVLTVALLLPMLIVLMCDLQLFGGVTWSGYVIGALFVAYVSAVLPMWFTRPNPVIFVPCAFASVALYLLYIALATGGDWFLPFAFPVVGGLTIIVTGVVTLMRYLPQGGLFIFGGAFIALGVFMLPVEILMCVTFESIVFVAWFTYPLITLVLLGGLLIFLGICRPARETMERKFFI